MKPERLQRKRLKGWRMPPGAVYVGRPTKWGNPFRATQDRTPAQAVDAFRIWLELDGCHAGLPDRKSEILRCLPDLRGKDLVCWCPLDRPCHADVLLEMANREE